MTQANPTRELQLLKEVSAVNVPANFFQSNGLKNLITDIVATGREVEEQSKTLARLRQEKADGYTIVNWLKNRGEKVEDANLALTMTVGKLTQQSSSLLVLNTAVSKVLHEQQEQLLAQQRQLKDQATSLREQNEEILRQQEQLERHQHDINEANRGLLEAKGVTQEQAQQLVGCVTRVIQAEQTLDIKLATALSTVDLRLSDVATAVEASLASARVELNEKQDTLETRLEARQRLDQEATFAERERLAEEQRTTFAAQTAAINRGMAEASTEQTRLHDALSAHLDAVNRNTSTRLDDLKTSVDAAEAESNHVSVSVKELEARLGVAERRSEQTRVSVVGLAVALVGLVGWHLFLALAG